MFSRTTAVEDFVANDKSKSRVVQLGEDPQTIFVIGYPDIDVMMSGNLPSIKEVKRHYEIDFREFAIAVYHPITTNVSAIKKQVKIFFDCLYPMILKEEKFFLTLQLYQ